MANLEAIANNEVIVNDEVIAVNDDAMENDEVMANDEAMVNDEVMANDEAIRYFRLVYLDSDGNLISRGRFHGRRPKQAATKAFTAIRKECGVDQKELCLIETTRNSGRKRFFYQGESVELDKPLEIKLGGNTVTYKRKNKVLKTKNLSEKFLNALQDM